MAVLTEGAGHGREGRRKGEELVYILFALNAGRMVAEERLCHSTHGWVRECAAHLWGFLGWMARMAGEARNVQFQRVQCAGDLECRELKSRSHQRLSSLRPVQLLYTPVRAMS